MQLANLYNICQDFFVPLLDEWNHPFHGKNERGVVVHLRVFQQNCQIENNFFNDKVVDLRKKV